MARRDDDEFDSFDDRPHKSKAGLPGWAIVLIVLALVVPVVLVGCIALFWASASLPAVQQAEAIQAETAAAQAAKGGMAKVYTRDEFKAMIGATPEDVTAALGEPNVKAVANDRITWIYQNKTMNPATGRTDPVAQVMFVGGVVVEVTF